MTFLYSKNFRHVENSLTLARAAFTGGLLGQAEQELTQALSFSTISRDEIIQVLMLRGSVAIAARRPRDAVKDWEAVLRIKPLHQEALRHLDGGMKAEQAKGVSQITPVSAPARASDYQHPSVVAPIPPFQHIFYPPPLPKNPTPPHPNTKLEGKIKLTSGSQDLVGYLGRVIVGDRYTIVNVLELADTFSMCITPDPSEIIAIKNTVPGRPCLGWSGSEPDLLPPIGHAILAPTVSNPQRLPIKTNYDILTPWTTRWVETSVWTFNPVTRQVTAQWISSNGDTRANYIWRNSFGLYLTASSDGPHFFPGDPKPATMVTLSFV